MKVEPRVGFLPVSVAAVVVWCLLLDLGGLCAPAWGQVFVQMTSGLGYTYYPRAVTSFNGGSIAGTRTRGAESEMFYCDTSYQMQVQPQQGRTDLGLGIAGTTSGFYIVGATTSQGVMSPRMWTNTITNFVTVAPPPGVASCISADGAWVAGDSNGLVFRWGRVGGLLGTSVAGTAAGISADGSTIVGTTSPTSPQGAWPFVWTPASGAAVLVDAAGAVRGRATACSADGAVIVGSLDAPEERAFRWTASTGYVRLPLLAGATASRAQSVSADGTYIVGWCTGGASPRAFLWSPLEGTLEVGELLRNSYLTNPTLSLETCDGMDPTGQTICGSGRNAAGATIGWFANIGFVAPNIVGQPLSGTHRAGANIAMTIVFDRDHQLATFQWRKGGAPLAESAHDSGTTSATLVIHGADASDAGLYDVLIRPIGRTAYLSASASIAISDRQTPRALCVRAGAQGANNGLSWADAFGSLPQAILAALPGDELWVAGGTYAGPVTLRPGIALYGGFAGVESRRDERDRVLHVTTVSGNNATRCFIATAGDAGTVVDGFTITGGLTRRTAPDNDPYGGGIIVSGGRVRFANCTITANNISTNSTSWWGTGFGCGAAVRSGADAQFDNVSFVTNKFGPFAGNMGYGGALYIDHASASFSGCVFDDNFTGISHPDGCSGGTPIGTFPAGDGGAIAAYNSDLTIDRCIFRRNRAGDGASGVMCSGSASSGRPGGRGGAIFASGCTVFMSNSAFADNTSGGGGSGITYGTIRYSFDANGGDGGAVYSDSTTTRIVNCTFAGNAAGVGGGATGLAGNGSAVFAAGGLFINSIVADDNGTGWTSRVAMPESSLSYSCLPGYAGAAPGMIGAAANFANLAGADGILGSADDDFSLRPDSPCLDAGNCGAVFGSLDLIGNARRVNVSGLPPTGQPRPRVDIGAVEFQACAADFDDGGGLGRPDGGVTIDDLVSYLVLFVAGDVRADVDDGTMAGTPDNSVTVEDLLYFLVHFSAGC